MSQVFRAHDRETSNAVALKILAAHAPSAERFAREGQLLATLVHPAIVRYVTHGIAPDGRAFLAMEWIEGETLAARLRRAPLALDEVVALARRLASALQSLHRSGVVHRDLKPGNVILPGADPTLAKLADLGVARRNLAADELTEPGAIIGTPGYMAPEQARAQRSVDARADVFAFGSLLFRCLSGSPAFVGEDALTVLLKVVLEDPPPLRELARDAPAGLASLVDEMLSKDPEGRPRDGGDVLARLEELEAEPARISRPPPALTATERKVVCLVIARTGRRGLARAVFTSPSSDVDAATDVGLLEVIEPYGGRLDVLADGSALVVLTEAAAPTDLATRAVRCALHMRALLGPAPVAVVSGRAVVTSRTPMGEVIARGVHLVSDAIARDTDAIRVDEVTAGLLDARFDIGVDDGGFVLRGERDLRSGRRTLLGRPTPTVGRDQELAILDAVFASSVAEPASRAVIVTGDAGVGKSRLRQEFVRRIAGPEKGSDADRTQVWIGRADPMSAGSAYGLVASAVRNGVGLEAEAPAVREQKLLARVGRHFEGAERLRVADFLAEITGIPRTGERSVELRSARKDATRMGYQIRRALADFLRAECEAAPLLVVLEDLQWGDLPTVSVIDAAMHDLAELPFMVVALARPEVNDIFPNLWSGRSVQTVRLGSLGKRACEKLVRQVLGPAVPDATLGLVVERSSGNAFYLEELIRSIAEGKHDALPETIVATAAARLERLDAEERRVLRAASVFGQVFTNTGVAALLGHRAQTPAGPASQTPAPSANAETNAWLDALVGREFITRRDHGPKSDGDRFAFRHAFVREAAYSMLTDADRALGHRLAGEWLESMGDADAITLAEHFERGSEPGRAIGWYRRAAEHALTGNDLEGTLSRVSRALDLDRTGAVEPSGDHRTTLGALRLLEAEAHRWRGSTEDAERSATLAMELSPKGDATWCRAASEIAITMATHGRHDRLEEVARALAAEAPLPAAHGVYAIVSASVAVRLSYSGRKELADELFRRASEIAIDVGDDPSVVAEIHQARAYRSHFDGDLSGLFRAASIAEASFRAAGELRNALQQRTNVGYAALELGDHDAAERHLRAAIADAAPLGLVAVVALAKHNLGLALARRGEVDEAEVVERAAVEAAAAQGNARMECGARLYLALILREARRFDAARAEARRALDATSAAPLLRPKALAAIAQIELSAGEIARALETSEEACAELDKLGAIEEGESLVRLVFAESLRASGELERAAAAIGRARSQLVERAAKIGEEGHRESFLTRVPENARIIALAALWATDA